MRKMFTCLVSSILIANIFASLNVSVGGSVGGTTSAAISTTGSLGGSVSVNGATTGAASTTVNVSTTTAGVSATGSTATTGALSAATAAAGGLTATVSTGSSTQAQATASVQTPQAPTSNSMMSNVAKKAPNEVAKNGGEAQVGYVETFLNVSPSVCLYKYLNLILYFPEEYQKLYEEAYKANKDTTRCFDPATVEKGMKAINEQLVQNVCTRFSVVNDNIGNSLSCFTSVNIAADSVYAKQQQAQPQGSANPTMPATSMTSTQISTQVSTAAMSGSRLRNLATAGVSANINVSGTTTGVTANIGTLTSGTGAVSGTISTSPATVSGTISTSPTTISGTISNIPTTVSGTISTTAQGTTTPPPTASVSINTQTTAPSTSTAQANDKTSNSLNKFKSGMQESANNIDKVRSALNSKIAKTVTDLQIWQAGRQKVLLATLDLASKCGTLDATTGMYTGFCFGNDDVTLLTKLVLDLGASYKNFNKVFTENTKTMKTCATNLATLFEGNCNDVIPLASASFKADNELPIVLPAKKSRRYLTAPPPTTTATAPTVTATVSAPTVTATVSAPTLTGSVTGSTTSLSGSATISAPTLSGSTTISAPTLSGSTTLQPAKDGAATTTTISGSIPLQPPSGSISGSIALQPGISISGASQTASLQGGDPLSDPCSLCNGDKFNIDKLQALIGPVPDVKFDPISVLDPNGGKRNLSVSISATVPTTTLTTTATTSNLSTSSSTSISATGPTLTTTAMTSNLSTSSSTSISGISPTLTTTATTSNLPTNISATAKDPNLTTNIMTTASIPTNFSTNFSANASANIPQSSDMLSAFTSAFDKCSCKNDAKNQINGLISMFTAASIDFNSFPIPDAVKAQCDKFSTANKGNSNGSDISACLGAQGGCMPMPQLYMQCSAYMNGQEIALPLSNLLTGGCTANDDYTITLASDKLTCTGNGCPTLVQPTTDANTTAMLGTKFWIVATCSKGSYSIVSYQEHPNFGKSFDCANSDTDKELLAEFKKLDMCAGNNKLTDEELKACGFPPGSNSCLDRLNQSCDNIGFDYYSEQFSNSNFEAHCFNECAPALLNNSDAAKAKAAKEACFKVIADRFLEVTFMPKYSAWEMFTDVCKSHNMGCVFFDDLKVETNPKCPWYDLLRDPTASNASGSGSRRRLQTTTSSIVINDSANTSIAPVAATSTSVDPNKAAISGSTSTKVATSSGISSTASKKATTVAKDSSFIKIAAGLLGLIMLML